MMKNICLQRHFYDEDPDIFEYSETQIEEINEFTVSIGLEFGPFRVRVLRPDLEYW